MINYAPMHKHSLIDFEKNRMVVVAALVFSFGFGERNG
jgi:hypothetical protein